MSEFTLLSQPLHSLLHYRREGVQGGLPFDEAEVPEDVDVGVLDVAKLGNGLPAADLT